MGIIERIREYGLRKGYYDPNDSYDEDEYEDVVDEEDDEYDDKHYRTQKLQRTVKRELEPIQSSSRPRFVSASSASPTSKVVNIHNNFQMQVVISYPETIDEASTVCEYIKSGKTVVVNLENVKHETAQRIVDFLGGVSYALDGDIQYVSNKIFVLAPNNVDITGQFKEELKSNGIIFSLR